MNVPQPDISPSGSWNVPSDVEQSIPDRFAQQVKIDPDRTVLISQSCQLTYRELDRAANGVANAFLNLSQTRDERVIVLARHDSPLLAGVLGVLKAGKIVVVLNPSDPVSRLRELAAHSEASFYLADAEYLSLAQQIASQSQIVVCLDDCLGGNTGDAVQSPGSPGDTAFLIYTSGSTGKPKGVIRSHRSMIHNAYRHACGLSLRPDDRMLHLAAMSGGSGLSGACTAILNGATLCLFPMMELGVNGLADWIETRGITVFSLSSSLFRSFMRTIPGSQRFEQVRIVRLSAETATADEISAIQNHFSVDCEVVHTLSSSETGTITRIRFAVGDFRGDRLLPVGVASEDIEILLLNEHDEPVSYGVPGEIVVRSRYLSSGYWRDETLTAARFSVDGGVVTFRSGDLGRRNSREFIEFAGRKDSRIKIRGYRIEPSEVEDAICRHAGITEAVVGERSRNEGSPQLVAWYTCNDSGTVSPQEMRSALLRSLPSYMIPSEFVPLKAFPIASNGKIDRARLRTIESVSSADRKPDLPRTETERRLARIWADAFHVEAIGRNDHFFELGGDSLIATVIVANIQTEWSVDLSMQSFGKRPTLRQLAKTIDRKSWFARTLSRSAIVPKSRDQSVPLTFHQQSIWNECRTLENRRGWTGCSDYRLRGDLNTELLQSCMQRLQQRHEILRTTFHLYEERPVARVHEKTEVSLELLDFSADPDPQEEATRFFREVAQQVQLDLGRLPLIRFWLIKVAENEHRLLRINHHIVSDGWSWRIYLNELSHLYEHLSKGSSAYLTDAPQYADFAWWQRDQLNLNSRRFLHSVRWWHKLLSPAPPVLKLPFERPEPCLEAVPADGVIYWSIDSRVSNRLNFLAEQNRTTYLPVRLAVFLATLAEANGQDDLMIGSYASGRTRMEWQNMFGMFANTVILRMRWNPKLTFLRWLRQVSKMVTGVLKNSEIPHHLLREQLKQADVVLPEINALFCVYHTPATREFGGLQISKAISEFATMPWGFWMQLDQHNEDRCYTAFDARRYDPSQVKVFIERYQTLLDLASCHPQERLCDLLQMKRTATTLSPLDPPSRFRPAA